MKSTADVDRLNLEHMRACMERIAEYVGDDSARFFADPMVRDAVLRNLQTLAESSQRIGEAMRSRAPEIPWKALTGFRNVLVHQYLGIDPVVVWRVVERELPLLRPAVERLIALLPPIGEEPS